MLILGIETSCDETAAAVVRDGRDILSNVIASQHDLHAEYQGVVPEIASRAHVERLTPVVRAAVSEAGLALRDIDAVAVGNRPGLIGSLLIGVAAAKALAWSLGRPLLGVDHVQAHLYAGLLGRDPCAWPALGLVVSGGHTAIYDCASPLELTRLGTTIDDAVGEAFDKVATILELGYPGGPALERAARSGDPRAHDLPISRLAPDSLDFSYSGLKTAALYAARGVPRRDAGRTLYQREARDLTPAQRADIAASFQRAAIDAIILKLTRALDRLASESRPPRALLVGGGVIANQSLRAALEALAQARHLDLRLPAMSLCVDNAAMIAGLAHILLEAGRTSDLSLRAVPTTACQ